jgi:superfamily II DNA/RNA helicase
MLDADDEDAVQQLIEEKKAEKYSSKDFRPELIKDLKSDLKILQEIDNLWKGIDKDPKLDKFIEILSTDPILKKNKLIIFTESKETANYLGGKLNPKFDNKVLVFSSDSNANVRTVVIDNFDPHTKRKKDDYRILVSTEILSEGVNLHNANAVINYDIPWNPTRMMQRVGRINRVDTKFEKIHTYNFFPAGPINVNISLQEAAEAKIQAFIEMLGNDAKLLTDEEIKSHDLFLRLTSKKMLTGEDDEDDPELKYLAFLRNIRDKDKDLFEKIKRLPKKARTARQYDIQKDSVITFFRKGKLRKIFMTNGMSNYEVDFFKAAEILEASSSTKRETLKPEFYQYLESNKKEFEKVFVNEKDELIVSGGRSQETKLLRTIKAIEKSHEFTEEDEEYLQKILELLKEGAIPKPTIKKILKKIENEKSPLRILAVIKVNVAPEFFHKPMTGNAADTQGPKEIILSEYLVGR